jgi:hypothetical protein
MGTIILVGLTPRSQGKYISQVQRFFFRFQVECPQCGTTYTIQFPSAGKFVSVLVSL